MADINSLKLAPITEENIVSVHKMCENNVLHLTQPLETFKNATLKSDLFDPELSVVASEKDGKIAAFFIVVLRRPFTFKKRKVAVLKFLVVEKSWRNKGLGTRLFEILLDRIKNSDKKCFRMRFEVMTSLPDYWCPGLDPKHTEAYFFLMKIGFKKGSERINLCVDLNIMSEEQPVSVLNGYKISRATLDDKEELRPLKFMQKVYRLGFWPEEVALSFKNDPITSFIAKDNNGRIIGWASHSIHFPGSFGPTGIKKSLRGKGLGGVLLNWCLWDIKQEGLKKAKILWVTGNTVYFYLKSKGARICEFFWTMKRRV